MPGFLHTQNFIVWEPCLCLPLLGPPWICRTQGLVGAVCTEILS